MKTGVDASLEEMLYDLEIVRCPVCGTRVWVQNPEGWEATLAATHEPKVVTPAEQR